MTLSEELREHVAMMEALLDGSVSAEAFEVEYPKLAYKATNVWTDELYDILQGAWSDAEVFTTFEPRKETDLDEAGLKASITNRLRDLRAYMQTRGL